ncbi:MAG TPA: hypothetical protein VKI17_12860 [Gemmataceae bacterium]|nr:hypothetical protein [Gemmataceae bacterium]
MDPYLEDEQFWPAFHQSLVTTCTKSCCQGSSGSLPFMADEWLRP